MIREKSAISIEESKTRAAGRESSESAEKKLVEAAKGGESAAFATLCERYAQQLLRAAYRITRSREDAEDAVQDALIRAFVHLREFDGRSSFATWLTRIAINSALMILRKKRTALDTAIVRTDNPGADGRGYEMADRAPNPEKRYAQREEARILRKAIQRLWPTLREVVEIHQLQERSMQETAEVVGISLAAAKGRLFHARMALRKSPMLRVMYQHRSGADFRALSAA
jgi:RNA polymerase sigma-70 factor (ECF subfamily)